MYRTRILGGLGLLVLGLLGCPTFAEHSLDGALPCDLEQQPAQCSGVDLTGFDLNFRTMRDADLSLASLRNASLINSDLTGADLSAADLTRADLSQARMDDTLLADVIWSATLCPDGTVSDDNGETCGGHLDEPAQLRERCDAKPDANCSAADLTGADLRFANLSGANLSGADMLDADLTGASLFEAQFTRETNIDGVVWSATLCPDDTLSDDNGGTCGGHLGSLVDMCYARPGTDCSDVVLAQADLRFANLSEADLAGADLSGADMGSVNLSGADLSEANLNNANMSWANLSEANLSGAKMFNVVLEGVIWSETICPDGTSSNDNGDTCGGHLDPQSTEDDFCDFRPGIDCSGQIFTALELSYANLESASLRNTFFQECTLDYANLKYTDLENVILQTGSLFRADLTGAQLGPRPLLGPDIWSETICPDGTNSDDNGDTCGGHLDPDVTLECNIQPGMACRNSDLSGANLAYANLTEADLTNALLVGATLNRANISHAQLVDTDLTGVNGLLVVADGASLTHALMRGATLPEISLVDAFLNDANLGPLLDERGEPTRSTTLELADMTRVDMVSANVQHAHMASAILDEGRLYNADFTGADLSGASMRIVRGDGALFNEANLLLADLTSASFNTR
ncbi:MAG: pentapeptide repeat-containing protein, partial [Myxococcota bacterium]